MINTNTMIKNIHNLSRYSQAISLDHSSLTMSTKYQEADIIIEKSIKILMVNSKASGIILQEFVSKRGYNQSDNKELGLSFNRYLFDDCLKYLETKKDYRVIKELQKYRLMKYKLLNEKEITKSLDTVNQQKGNSKGKTLTKI